VVVCVEEERGGARRSEEERGGAASGCPYMFKPVKLPLIEDPPYNPSTPSLNER